MSGVDFYYVRVWKVQVQQFLLGKYYDMGQAS